MILLIDGIQGPALADYLNKNIKSHNRATVNSISNLTRTIMMAIVLPIFGRIGDNFGINKVFLTATIAIALSFILIKIWYRKI